MCLRYFSQTKNQRITVKHLIRLFFEPLNQHLLLCFSMRWFATPLPTSTVFVWLLLPWKYASIYDTSLCGDNTVFTTWKCNWFTYRSKTNASKKLFALFSSITKMKVAILCAVEMWNQMMHNFIATIRKTILAFMALFYIYLFRHTEKQTFLSIFFSLCHFLDVLLMHAFWFWEKERTSRN